jgi:hypothetical protein
MTDYWNKTHDFSGAEASPSSVPIAETPENIGLSVGSTHVAPLRTSPLAPSVELPAIESELFDRARAAMAALRGRGRQPNGQAGPGNTLNLRHGLRSARLIDQPDIAAWHREQVQIITADLGGEAELAALKRAAVREAARLEVICAGLGDDLLYRGALTGKGKARAATLLYLQVVDRFVRLATTLGFQRQARPMSLADWLTTPPTHEATDDGSH